jgi:hypothetical protein
MESFFHLFLSNEPGTTLALHRNFTRFIVSCSDPDPRGSGLFWSNTDPDVWERIGSRSEANKLFCFRHCCGSGRFQKLFGRIQIWTFGKGYESDSGSGSGSEAQKIDTFLVSVADSVGSGHFLVISGSGHLGKFVA